MHAAPKISSLVEAVPFVTIFHSSAVGSIVYRLPILPRLPIPPPTVNALKANALSDCGR